MGIYQRLDEKINEKELSNEVDQFLENKRNYVESNHRIEGKGSALEMAISGSKLMKKRLPVTDN